MNQGIVYDETDRHLARPAALGDAWASCIRACEACIARCTDFAAFAATSGDADDLQKCRALAVECAAFCRFAVALMQRETDHASTFCTLCAAVCEACAFECGRHDEHREAARCAAACRLCAEECRVMVAQPGALH
jgi:hypothetical protein